MNISNPLIEESLFDSTNKDDGKEIYAKDCHILPALTPKRCKSLSQTTRIQMQLSNIQNLTLKNYLSILRDNEFLQSATQLRHQNVFIARNRTT